MPWAARRARSRRFSVRLHDDREHVTITISRPADQLPEIATQQKGAGKP
jgi:hypothetical protein